MSKKILALILALVMCFALAACGGSSSSVASEASSEAESSSEATVNFPTRGITVICPWAAGGGTDAILRAICLAAQKPLGVTLTVNNTTGGSGATGHAAIMNADPDGYNVGMITFELNSLPPQGLVPFTYEDFDPIMRINMDAAALTVPADAPYNTLAEFVEYAKANPNTITIGNSGPGGVWHIAAGLMEQTCGITCKHVPYDGAAPAVTDLIASGIDAVTVSVAEVQSYVQSGQLKILAIMSDEHSALFPDVPTFADEGYDVVFGTWRGLALPKGVPEAERQILIDAFTEAYNDQTFQDYAASVGLGLAYLDADDFYTFLGENAAMVKDTMIALGLATA